MQDLERFERDGKQSELLDVLAACLRHGYPLTVNLQWTDRVVPLTLFPAERLGALSGVDAAVLVEPLE